MADTIPVSNIAEMTWSAHSTGEHLGDGHGSLAALISQLINAAPTTLGQEAQIRLAVL